MKRAPIVALALVLLAGSSAGYYHFVHYTSRTGPFVPIFEKFDLAALPNRTVYFYISDSGPAVMAPGDSFAAIVSQVRLAGRVWNEVATSELRVAYGGLFSAGTPQST